MNLSTHNRAAPPRAQALLFEHVAAALGLAPRSILFFDDLAENVEGARSAGLQAVHVRDSRDVRDALRQAGMIPK